MDEDIFDESMLFFAFDSVESSGENAAVHSGTRSESASRSELNALKQENDLLKKLLCKIGVNPSEDKLLANVLFYKSSYLKQGELEDFVCYLARNSAQNNVLNESSMPSSGKSNILNDGFAAAVGKISNGTKKSEELSDLPISCVQYFASFCVDRFGSNAEKIFPTPPNYDRVYFKTLPEETGSKVSQRRKKVCFNCDGDHRLNECPRRRDIARISMKRKEFMESRPFTNESRYHEDKTKLEQYQHFRPGVISSKLREALSLSEHDLPPFIYRMRMLGYPPSWLPSNHDSGIVLYGAEGKEESKESRHGHEKYVRYPGFNVPLPRECKDLARMVHLPPMQHQHQLNIEPEDDLSSETDNNKRKFSSEEEESYYQSKKARSYTESDMDVDDEEPPGTTSVIYTMKPDGERCTQSVSKRGELEDGEIADSPEGSGVINEQSWWLNEPLVAHFKAGGQEFMPPPFPLTPLPLHKISQILPGELNHISFEDRSRWLDPIFGNLQVRTGRFEKLKTILAARENKRKSL